VHTEVQLTTTSPRDPWQRATREQAARTGVRLAVLTPLVLVLALVIALVVALAGCSSTKHHGPGAAPTTSSGGSAAPAADTAAITNLYTHFVTPGLPIDQRVTMVQDGEAFRDSMIALSGSDFAKTVSISVSKVVLNSPNLATVTYSILISGSPVLPNATGNAVKTNGSWQVAGATLCGLLQAYNPKLPPACSQPAATSLPK
jgi:hypothetical protein